LQSLGVCAYCRPQTRFFLLTPASTRIRMHLESPSPLKGASVLSSCDASRHLSCWPALPHTMVRANVMRLDPTLPSFPFSRARGEILNGFLSFFPGRWLTCGLCLSVSFSRASGAYLRVCRPGSIGLTLTLSRSSRRPDDLVRRTRFLSSDLTGSLLALSIRSLKCERFSIWARLPWCAPRRAEFKLFSSSLSDSLT